MADLGMAAFAVIFLQCPSFLSAQNHLDSRQGGSNARTLFGIERIACDNHMRDMLDGNPPEHFDRMFHHVVNDLDGSGGLDFLRQLDGRLPVALDGTEYFASCNLGCRNRSTRLRSNGRVENFHAMLGTSIVAPGTNHLLPLPPEFIRPKDGDEKQDREIKAAKRWLKRVGPAVDERRADQGRRGRPEGQLVRDHRRLAVRRAAITQRVRRRSRSRQRYRRGIGKRARARWKVENNALGILKDSFNLEQQLRPRQRYARRPAGDRST